MAKDRRKDMKGNENPFRFDDICDGNGCGVKGRCARYIGNVDTGEAGARWVNFIKTDLPAGCGHFMEAPNPAYPYARHAGGGDADTPAVEFTEADALVTDEPTA